MRITRSFIVSIILIVISLYLLFKVRHLAADVPMNSLLSVLTPGKYIGTGKYAPTDHYSNGLNTKLFMTVKQTKNGLETNVQINAFDASTGKHEYTGIRNATFDYKPNHGMNVFKNSKSFIGGEIVSSSHGKVISCSDNELVISSAGSWHTSSYEHDIINTIRKDGNKIYASFDNTGMIPFLHSHTMDEEYTYVER